MVKRGWGVHKDESIFETAAVRVRKYENNTIHRSRSINIRQTDRITNDELWRRSHRRRRTHMHSCSAGAHLTCLHDLTHQSIALGECPALGCCPTRRCPPNPCTSLAIVVTARKWPQNNPTNCIVCGPHSLLMIKPRGCTLTPAT